MDFNFADYIKNLASQHPLILHAQGSKRFYRMSSLDALEEVLTNLLTAKTPAIGINDTLEGRVIDHDADRKIDRQLYTFYVFGRSPLFDHSERKRVTLECKDIAIDFVNKIITDHLSDFSLSSSNGLRHLDVNSFTYRTLGNLPDGLLAIIVSFVLDQPVSKGSVFQTATKKISKP